MLKWTLKGWRCGVLRDTLCSCCGFSCVFFQALPVSLQGVKVSWRGCTGSWSKSKGWIRASLLDSNECLLRLKSPCCCACAVFSRASLHCDAAFSCVPCTLSFSPQSCLEKFWEICIWEATLSLLTLVCVIWKGKKFALLCIKILIGEKVIEQNCGILLHERGNLNEMVLWNGMITFLSTGCARWLAEAVQARRENGGEKIGSG